VKVSSVMQQAAVSVHQMVVVEMLLTLHLMSWLLSALLYANYHVELVCRRFESSHCRF
jgi:hypothetical protein